MDEETENMFDHMDQHESYDPNDGVDEQYDTDAHMYTHDETACEEDWIPHDFWQDWYSSIDLC